MEMLTILLRILEVEGSNIRQTARYSGQGFFVILFLIVCNLFNGGISNAAYIASNDCVTANKGLDKTQKKSDLE
jgi:hypothetical protein